VIVGIDLGSSRTAVAAAFSSLPLHVGAAHTIQVNPTGAPLDDLDVQPAVDEALEIVDAAKAEQVVIEHRPWYPARGKSDRAQMAIQKAHRICERQKDALLDGLRARGYRLHDYKALDHRQPIHSKAIFICPRIAWAARAVPHTQGSISDQMAWDGLRVHVAEGLDMLEADNVRDVQDKRDAVGCMLVALLPPAKKHRKARAGAPKPKPTEAELEARKEALRAKDAARKAHKRGKPSAEERAAAGCTCGRGGVVRKHREGCPLAKGDPLDALLKIAS